MSTPAQRTLLKYALSAAILAMGVGASSAALCQVSSYHACTTPDPASNEVFVYRDAGYLGPCAALYMGFYPHGGNLGIGSDQMSSIKVGSSVRARVFLDDTYGRSFLIFTAGSYASMPGGWNDQVSSARIEDASRSVNCNDLRTNEFALFWDVNFGRDCVVLNTATLVWDTPDQLGIMNDSVSSIVVAPGTLGARNINLFYNANCYELGGTFQPFGQPANIPNLGTYGFNDQLSCIMIF